MVDADLAHALAHGHDRNVEQAQGTQEHDDAADDHDDVRDGAKLLLAAGQGRESLMRLCGIGDYPARKLLSAAGHLSREFCDRAVLLCTETDYQMKTSYDDPQRLLELLLLRLSEEARHG